jgi:cytidylate kinase
MPPFPPGSVVAITGIMGAGKSTVAQRLADSLPRAVHVRGDLFRRMIVTARAEMVPGAGDDAVSQLRLRYALAAQAVDGYASAGFTAVYQDIILGDDLAAIAHRIRSRPLFVVVLAPRAEVALARADARSKASGYGEWTADALDQLLRATPRLGLWLDTSDQTADQTADDIRARAEEARLRDARLAVGSHAHVLLVKHDDDLVAYDASVLSDDGNHLVVQAPWIEDRPRDLGFAVFEPGDVFIEHYWRDRWYSIKEVRDRDAVLKGWYCDVAHPAQVQASVIVSADLILDLWVPATGKPLRLDEDEFADSALVRAESLATRARSALAELERLAADQFPGIAT